MAKFHYEQRVFHEGFAQVSVPLTTPPQTTQVATRLTTDTWVRGILQPILTCEIDEAGSPPTDPWWAATRVVMAVRFDSSGTSGAGSSPFAASVLCNLELYPRLVPANTGYDLHYVIWEPLDGATRIVTSRKGDGVNFPRITTSMFCFDHNGVFLNPGSLYSVKFNHRWTMTSVWASDSPV